MRYFLLFSLLSCFACGQMDSDTSQANETLSDSLIVEEEAEKTQDESDIFQEDYEVLSSDELNMTRTVTFNKDIKPLIKKHCIFCHNGLVPARQNLGRYNVAKQYGEIMLAYMEGNGNVVMPPSGKLPEEKVNLVRQWVETGKQK